MGISGFIIQYNRVVCKSNMYYLLDWTSPIYVLIVKSRSLLIFVLNLNPIVSHDMFQFSCKNGELSLHSLSICSRFSCYDILFI